MGIIIWMILFIIKQFGTEYDWNCHHVSKCLRYLDTSSVAGVSAGSCISTVIVISDLDERDFDYVEPFSHISCTDFPYYGTICCAYFEILCVNGANSMLNHYPLTYDERFHGLNDRS